MQMLQNYSISPNFELLMGLLKWEEKSVTGKFLRWPFKRELAFFTSILYLLLKLSQWF